MCVVAKPKVNQTKQIAPQAPQIAEEPPEPVKIEKEGSERKRRQRNPLRIDMKSSGERPRSGVNV